MTNSPIQIVNRVRGEWDLSVVKAKSGTIKKRLQFPNLILNSGLDALCDSSDNTGQAIVVGEGTPAPDAAQTQLVNLTATASEGSSPFYNAAINTPGPPYFGRSTVTRQFAVGAAAGNLTEIGLCQGANQVALPLFSRSLIVDGGGNPIALTVLSDEILIATHRCYQYVMTGDITGSVNLGPSTHDFIIRSMYAATANNNGIIRALDNLAQNQFQGGDTAKAFATQTLADITGIPAGTVVAQAVTWAAQTYSPGTFNRNIKMTANISQLNVAGGIGILCINTTRGAYQIRFDPVIPKDSNKTLEMTFNFAVARL